MCFDMFCMRMLATNAIVTVLYRSSTWLEHGTCEHFVS